MENQKIPSIKNLRAICQPINVLSRENETWYSKLFIRKFSIYLTRLLLPLNISANNVSLLSLFFNIIAAVFLAAGLYLCLIIGALMLQLAAILDAVDGEIARYKKTASQKGKIIENISTSIYIPILFIGLGLSVYNSTQDTLYIFLGISAMLAFLWSIIIQHNKIIFNKTSINNFSVNIKSSNISNKKLNDIFKILSRAFGMATVINLILIAVLITLFSPTISIGIIKTTPLGLILLFYGIFPHAAWIIPLKKLIS